MGGPLDLATRLRSLETLALDARPDALVALGREVISSSLNGTAAGEVHSLVHSLLDLVQSGAGTTRQRLDVGEVLGLLGDPRLRRPNDPDYWVTVSSEEGDITIARFPVTNAEFSDWAQSGYNDLKVWSEEGAHWLASCSDPWPNHASQEASRRFVIPNHPVVGVTFWEAQAYATAHGARLPRSDERVWVIRGRERRPYPWGEPFREGHANTKEEVLQRPCAVGLYLRDRTPEGVSDLAGNVAEWMADEIGDQRLIHPGAWDQPSMASWAKAVAIHPPDTRWAGLGFRLARD